MHPYKILYLLSFSSLVHYLNEFGKNNLKQSVTLFTKGRANPGAEFVVANTLTKWKKVEPNEINLCQGFSQNVVSTGCCSY